MKLRCFSKEKRKKEEKVPAEALIVVLDRNEIEI